MAAGKSELHYVGHLEIQVKNQPVLQLKSLLLVTGQSFILAKASADWMKGPPTLWRATCFIQNPPI